MCVRLNDNSYCLTETWLFVDLFITFVVYATREVARSVCVCVFYYFVWTLKLSYGCVYGLQCTDSEQCHRFPLNIRTTFPSKLPVPIPTSHHGAQLCHLSLSLAFALRRQHFSVLHSAFIDVGSWLCACVREKDRDTVFVCTSLKVGWGQNPFGHPPPSQSAHRCYPTSYVWHTWSL